MFFTVIVPVYNVENHIGKCIDSILAQNFTDYEVILVDDGSTDGSGDICDKYAAKHKAVRVIHKKNGGLVSARNTGIKQAHGDYVLYVDGDDWVTHNWLEVIKSSIDEAPVRPDMVIFGSIMKYDNKDIANLINTREGFYNRGQIESEIFPRLISDREQYFGEAVFLPASWNKAYKRELLKEHHCFDEKVMIGEDTAYVFEDIFYAQSLVVCKEVLYYYNKMTTASILTKKDPDRLKKRLHLFEYIKSHLMGLNPVLDCQMNDFYASRLVYDLLYFNRQELSPFKKGKFYKKQLKETRILKYVHLENIPFKAKIVIAMLKLGFCRTLFLGLKVVGYQ